MVPRVALLAGALVMLAVLTVGSVYQNERARLKASEGLVEILQGRPEPRLLFFWEGVKTPTARRADGAPLGDDEEVIGVEMGGKSRAYRLRAMDPKTRHIINDLVGDVPVTVTYCNAKQCVRGFGGAAGAGPLDVSQAGMLGGGMVVKVGGVVYSQETGAVVELDPGHFAVPFPYAEIPLTRTTWGQWKTRYPETDVYVGDEAVGG